ncbi:MAG: N-acetyltransferase family protein [Pseudomonadota bacterium]
MTERPVVRMARVEDAAAVQAIYAPIVEGTVISFEDKAPSVEKIGRRIETTLAAFPYLVAELDGKVVGFAYAGGHGKRRGYYRAANIGIYVAEEVRGAGVGKAIYGVLLPELEARGIHTVMAAIVVPNDASVRLHEGMGFVKAGVFREVGHKFGRYLDVGWWQLTFDGPA